MRKFFLTDHSATRDLKLTLAPGALDPFARAWAPALHDGFALRVPGALSVRDLLTSLAGLDPAYVDERIRAVFVEGHPVDDIDAAPVPPGQELSLSAAMPGVAGIVMGRANPFAAYREGITFRPGDAAASGPGLILVKLFNFIAAETAARFLALGAGLDRRAWERAMADTTPAFWEPVLDAELDGEPLAQDDLRRLPPPEPGEIRFLRLGPVDNGMPSRA